MAESPGSEGVKVTPSRLEQLPVELAVKCFQDLPITMLLTLAGLSRATRSLVLTSINMMFTNKIADMQPDQYGMILEVHHQDFQQDTTLKFSHFHHPPGIVDGFAQLKLSTPITIETDQPNPRLLITCLMKQVIPRRCSLGPNTQFSFSRLFEELCVVNDRSSIVVTEDCLTVNAIPLGDFGMQLTTVDINPLKCLYMCSMAE
ncbi:hypothetical protein O181_043918 [Austropuccinia psidii MF-1]|uniref:F-box domain-containing protein n=1 Tax=Austropuccinia psidii MF-1 TaxID=1389203 RepID=A0A9Q3HG62_9BASI|nr:hypothetical protein [Austropuccinia psidii MF-1]